MRIIIFYNIFMLKNNFYGKQTTFSRSINYYVFTNNDLMKKVILTVLFVLISVPFLSAQNNQTTKNPVGTWKFEAPYAPEGYSSGMIVVGMEEKKPTTSISFTGSDYKIPGEQVRNANDSITFSVFLEGQDIKVMLKMEDETKMSGKAVYSEGEVPLTLTKTVSIN